MFSKYLFDIFVLSLNLFHSRILKKRVFLNGFEIQTLIQNPGHDWGSIEQGYLLYLKQCNYGKNTVTVHKIILAWLNSPPPINDFVTFNFEQSLDV